MVRKECSSYKRANTADQAGRPLSVLGTCNNDIIRMLEPLQHWVPAVALNVFTFMHSLSTNISGLLFVPGPVLWGTDMLVNKTSLSSFYDKHSGWIRIGRERNKWVKIKSLAASLQSKWNDLGTDRKRENCGKAEERKARSRERSRKSVGVVGDTSHRPPQAPPPK